MDEHVPCGAHVVGQVLDVAADEHAGERVDGSHDHVVATADSENEAAAAQAVIRVGGDDDVCRGSLFIASEPDSVLDVGNAGRRF